MHMLLRRLWRKAPAREDVDQFEGTPMKPHMLMVHERKSDMAMCNPTV